MQEPKAMRGARPGDAAQPLLGGQANLQYWEP